MTKAAADAADVPTNQLVMIDSVPVLPTAVSACGKSILKPNPCVADHSNSRQLQRQPAMRVEICEQRNKLIFYRQDLGWQLGYFAEHRNRHTRQQKHRAQHGQRVQESTGTDSSKTQQPATTLSAPAVCRSAGRRSASFPPGDGTPVQPPSSSSFNPSSSSSSSSGDDEASPRLLSPNRRCTSAGSRGAISAGDLEISLRVIHACTDGCFAINS